MTRGKDSRNRLLEAGMELLAESSRGDLGRVLTTGAVAERAVSLRPWRADGWRRLAQVLESEGDVEGARRASERAAAASDRP